MALSKNSVIQLKLSAQEINTVLDGLAAMPYKDVFHLIENIHQQVKIQSNSNIVVSKQNQDSINKSSQ